MLETLKGITTALTDAAANDFQLVKRLLPRLRSSAWVSQSLRIRKHVRQYSRYAIEAASKFLPIASFIGRNKETLAEVVNHR